MRKLLVFMDEVKDVNNNFKSLLKRTNAVKTLIISNKSRQKDILLISFTSKINTKQKDLKEEENERVQNCYNFSFRKLNKHLCSLIIVYWTFARDNHCLNCKCD